MFRKISNKLLYLFLFALFLFLINSFSLFAQESSYGCCVDYGSGCSSNVEKSQCTGEFFESVSCDEVAECQGNTGVCVPTQQTVPLGFTQCTIVDSPSLCLQNAKFIAGVTINQVAECNVGCCSCQIENSCVYSAITTKAECDVKCNERSSTSSFISDVTDLNICQQNYCAQAQQQYTLSGRILDSQSNPLKDATIIVSKNQKGILTTSSKEDGSYTLSLSPGKYNITIYLFGYKLNKSEIILTNDKTKNFILIKTGLNILQGKVYYIVYNQKISIPNLLLYLSGQKSLKTKTKEDGSFKFIDLPSGDYSLTVFGGNDFFDKSFEFSFKENELIKKDIELLPANKGDLLINVYDLDNNLIPGVRIIIENLNKKCTTQSSGINKGKCTISGIREGTHTITINKEGYDSVQKEVNIKKKQLNLLVIKLKKIQTWCYNYTKDPIKYSCKGPDNKVGTYDDCCTDSQFCNADTGLCTDIIQKQLCDSTCSYSGELSDGLCHLECYGLNDCSPKEDIYYQILEKCNNKPIGSKIKFNQTHDVICCNSLPKIYEEEEILCSDGIDNDGDNLIDCLDNDCYQKECGDNKICRSNINGQLGCFPKTCSSGKITDEYCSCGETITTSQNLGKYCCQKDGEIYDDESSYNSSPCGLNECTSYTQLDDSGDEISGECALSCLDENGEILDLNSPSSDFYSNFLLKSNACGYSNLYQKDLVCCPSNKITPQPPFTCKYKWQCDDILYNTIADLDNKIGCNEPCKQIPSCYKNAEISLNPLPNCFCGNEEVSTQNNNQYCCIDSSNNYYLSYQPCSKPFEKGVFSGIVLDNKTKKPLINAYIYNYNDLLTSVSYNNPGHFETSLIYGPYNVYALANGYKKSSNFKFILSSDNKKIIKTFYLDPILDPCENETYPVLYFNAFPIKGKVYNVNLTWQPPNCQNILGYALYRDNQPIKFLQSTNFIDNISQPNTKYTYQIQVIYGPDRLSVKNETVFESGDDICNNKYDEEFCDFNIRSFCDSNNKKIQIKDCSSLNKNDDVYLCNGPNKLGDTSCKLANQCGAFKQQALPFGLYFQKESCLNPDNYCYFDYYKSIFSSTTIDLCLDCSQISSCFDYNSKDACLKNSCSFNKDSCSWVDTYPELGLGYCAPSNYSATDKCDLCNADNNALNNKNILTDCNQQVCSSLGSCFSKQNSCLSCEQATCESYETKEQCVGSQSFYISNNNLTFYYSQDSCDIGRCKWDSLNNKCYKDANDFGGSDCNQETTNNPEECKKDYTPPSTKLLGNIIMLGPSKDTLTFVSSSDAESLTYCIDKLNKCIPNQRLFYDYNKKIILDKKDLSINKLGGINSKGVYYVRFYSIDKNKNQEELNSRLIYIDFFPPIINIEQNINLGESKPDTLSEVSLVITLDEKATCSDSLLTIDDKPLKSLIKNKKSDQFSIKYSLKDGLYKYSITCKDPSNNIATKTINILVDAYKNIKVLSPKEIVSSNNVLFNIKTADKSKCNLLYKSKKIPLIPINLNNPVQHKLSYTFPKYSNYYKNLKVECIGIETKALDIAYIPLVIDLTPPKTSLILKYNDNEEELFDNFEYLINQEVSLDISCNDYPIGDSNKSLGVNKQSKKVCLTSILNNKCQPDIFVSKVKLNKTSTLCYSCSDTGNNIALTKCGIIKIDKQKPSLTLSLFELPSEELIQLYKNVNISFNKIIKPTRGVSFKKQYLVLIKSSEELKNINLFYTIDASGPLGNYQSIIPLYSLYDSLPDLISDQLSYLKQKNYINDKQLERYYIGLFSLPSDNEEAHDLFLNLKNQQAHFIIKAEDLASNFVKDINNYFNITTFSSPSPILINFKEEIKPVNKRSFKLKGIEGSKKGLRDIFLIKKSYSNPSNTSVSSNFPNTSISSNPSNIESIDYLHVTSLPSPNLLAKMQYLSPVKKEKNSLYAKALSVSDLSIPSKYVEFPIPSPDYSLYKVIDLQKLNNNQYKLSLNPSLYLDPNYYYNKEFFIYDVDKPEGYFEMNIPVNTNLISFETFSLDENKIESLHSSRKLIYFDNIPPSLKYYYPLDKMKIPSPFYFNGLLFDKGGLNCKDINITILQLNNKSILKPRCSGLTQLFLTTKQISLKEGPVKLILNVKDLASNFKQFIFNYEINNSYLSYPKITNLYCESISCYTNKKQLELYLEFIQSASITNSYITPIHGTINNSKKTFTLDTIQLTDKQYKLSLPLNFSEGLFNLIITAKKPNVKYLKNYSFFIINDKTIPKVISFNYPKLTSKEKINIKALYKESNIYHISLSGDIFEKDFSLEQLPMLVDNYHNFQSEIKLKSGLITDDRIITFTLIDKAGNKNILNYSLIYDNLFPKILGLSLKVDDKYKLIETSADIYKTNADVVQISIVTDKVINKDLINKITPFFDITQSKDGKTISFKYKLIDTKNYPFIILSSLTGKQTIKKITIIKDKEKPDVIVRWT